MLFKMKHVILSIWEQISGSNEVSCPFHNLEEKKSIDFVSFLSVLINMKFIILSQKNSKEKPELRLILIMILK